VLLVTGVIGAMLLLKALVLVGVTLALNWVRNLAAHGYANRGDRMTITEQLTDSINLTGQTWLTVFLFPVGLRYHALHHLFPFLPYHSLGEAHARLMERLPADAPYRKVNRDSFFAAVAALWRGARATSAEDSVIPRWRLRNTRT
jgi:fatty acid desaturase